MKEEQAAQETIATPRIKAWLALCWFCPDCGWRNVTTLSHWAFHKKSECTKCERCVEVVEP